MISYYTAARNAQGNSVRGKDLEKENQIESRKAVLNRHTQSTLWIIASLFALNSAGAVAMISRRSEDEWNLSALLFSYGIFCALFTGIFGRQSDAWHLRELGIRLSNIPYRHFPLKLAGKSSPKELGAEDCRHRKKIWKALSYATALASLLSAMTAGCLMFAS